MIMLERLFMYPILWDCAGYEFLVELLALGLV